MGGSIRKDMNSKVTHLICNAAGGDKYKYAITFRLGVVRPAWVEEAWKNRDAPEFMATKDDFTINHRLKVFEGQRICFTGFPPEEHKHMEEVLRSNGGIPSTVDNPECTHVVSDLVKSALHAPSLLKSPWSPPSRWTAAFLTCPSPAPPPSESPLQLHWAFGFSFSVSILILVTTTMGNHWYN